LLKTDTRKKQPAHTQPDYINCPLSTFNYSLSTNSGLRKAPRQSAAGPYGSLLLSGTPEPGRTAPAIYFELSTFNYSLSTNPGLRRTPHRQRPGKNRFNETPESVIILLRSWPEILFPPVNGSGF
jgi:hypothetical protein